MNKPQHLFTEFKKELIRMFQGDKEFVGSASGREALWDGSTGHRVVDQYGNPTQLFQLYEEPGFKKSIYYADEDGVLRPLELIKLEEIDLDETPLLSSNDPRYEKP